MFIVIVVITLVMLIISFFRKIKKDSNLENEAPAHQQENKAVASKTGIYQIKDGLLLPMSTLSGDGSINSINASFNYNPDMVATIITNKLVLVEFVVVDKSNLKPLYFGMKDTAMVPSYRDIEMDLKRVDWNFERTLF